jgi:prepilin-type N-terminal cleavage/methylation domain-containing protein
MLRKSRGFTIVELLIATSVFSLVLIVFLTAVLRVGQLFYKGVSMSNTQESARNVLQSISDDLQFTNQAPILPDPSLNQDYFCIGNHRYAYLLGHQVGSGGGLANDYGLVRETRTCNTVSDGLSPQATDPNNRIEMLDPGMQINQIKLTNQANNGVNVKIHIVYYGGDKRVFSSNQSGFINDINNPGYDAYKAPDAQCTGPASGSQFCATADYNSTILQRF